VTLTALHVVPDKFANGSGLSAGSMTGSANADPGPIPSGLAVREDTSHSVSHDDGVYGSRLSARKSSLGRDDRLRI
jgi:hypothetical protein